MSSDRKLSLTLEGIVVTPSQRLSQRVNVNDYPRGVQRDIAASRYDLTDRHDCITSHPMEPAKGTLVKSTRSFFAD